MDFELLRSLVAVADAGTVTDAAVRLHVSQSALSRRLQQAETELDEQLFVRGRHGVELTDAGQLAVLEARAILGRYERLREEIDDRRHLRRGVVRVGGGATVTSFLLPDAIARFQHNHPGVRFRVKEAGSAEIARDVAAGELELGLVTLPLAALDLDVATFLVDEIVLAARKDHPLATRRAVPASQLAGLGFVAFEQHSAIRSLIDSALAAAGIEVEVMMELRSIPSMLRMVRTTGCLAFVSRLSLDDEPDLRAVSVRDMSISRTIGLATRRSAPLSAAGAAFAAVLQPRSARARRQGEPGRHERSR